MSDEAAPTFSDTRAFMLQNALADMGAQGAIFQGEAVRVTGFVALVDCIDSNGQQVLAMLASPHNTTTTTLGYTKALSIRAENVARNMWGF